MANKIAPALVLRDGDREKLEAMLRTPMPAARPGRQRARIVLLAAKGTANYEIVARGDRANSEAGANR